MGKSAGKQQISEYRMSLHYAFCSGPVDEITGLYIDKKSMWEGSQDESGLLTINAPKLFGGKKKEGGPVGQAFLLFGEDDQVIPDFLAQKMDPTETSETCPAYRGITSIFFTGAPTKATPPPSNWILKALWNAAQVAGGFLWGNNNPYLKPISARMFRAPKGLSPELATISKTVDGKTYRAANPSHMIYECYTNAEVGLGEDPVAFDTVAFEAAAQTLYNEEFGLAMRWSRQTPVENIVSEILDHIQAVIYEDLRTGLTTIKLLRNDYDPETLPEITPDNARISDFQRRGLGETTNEIVVSWTNPDNEEPAQVTWQNPTNVANQGGQVVSDTRDYHGVRWASLAIELAQRDLRAVSAPLASCKAEVDRSLWDKVQPGAVLKMPWAIDGVDLTLLMRVMNADFGTPGQSGIKLSLLEDIWSLRRTDYGAPTSSWIDPATAPDPVTDYLLFTLPALMAGQVPILSGADYPEVGAGVLSAPPSDDSQLVELYGWAAASTGVSGWTDLGWRSLSGKINLSLALSAEASTDLYEFPADSTNLGPVQDGYVFFGDGDDADFEIALITAQTGDGEGWVLRRGVLDTVPRTWPVGTPAWFVSPIGRVADDTTIRAAGETLRFKLLDKTSVGTYALSDADEINYQLTDRPYLPLRPANVQVNGVAFGSVDVADATEIVITWATRNRLLETTQILDWTDGSVAPEYRQRSVVTLRNSAGDAIILQWLGLWTENTLSFPKSYLERFDQVWVEVISERDGFESLQGHRILITGLPNNPAGAAPPTLPEPGDPPPPSAAPGSDAFSATGSYVPGANGSRVPIIAVLGQADDERASAVVIETRPDGSSPWGRVSITVPENGALRVEIRGVAPVTLYNVRVAYITPLGLGAWLDLDDVTTGALIAGDTASVGGVPAGDLLDSVNEGAASALAAAEALLSEMLARVEYNVQERAAGFIGSKPAAYVLAKQISDEAADRAQALLDEADARTAAVEAAAAAAATALLAEAAARGAAISTEATTRETEDLSLASSITTVTAALSDEISDRAAAISTESSARAAADAAEVSSRETLAAQMRGTYTGTDVSVVTTGLIYNERIARANADSALATSITLLSAGVGEQFDSLSIWYFDTGVESWTGNGTPTATDGWLRPYDDASDPYVVSPAGIAADAATYSQVRMRVRKTGTITWGGYLWWRSPTDSTWDSARRVSLTEPTWDAHDIGLVTVSPGWTGTIDKIRIDLTTAQDSSNYAEFDWIAVGRPSPGASSAALFEEQTTRASADDALAFNLLALTTTVGTNTADIASEVSARAAADSAEAASREALSVKMTGLTDPSGATLAGVTSGLVYDERSARVSADGSLSTSISTVQANVDSVSADVSTEASARATADAALATSISTLSATANAKNRVYRQGAFPTTDLVVGDVCYRTDQGNKSYRYNGSTWDATDDTRIATNDAAIVNEASVRATADAALSSTLTTVSATANAKNRIYRQSSFPTTDLVVGDICYRTDLNSVPYRYNGSTWDATDDTRVATTAAALTAETVARANADSAEVTLRQALSSKLTGLTDPSGATLAGVTSGLIFDERTARSTATSALASDITTLQASAATNASAISTEATARAAADSASAVRIDVLYATNGAFSTYSLDPTHQNWPVANTLPTNVITSGTAPTTTRLTSGVIYGEKALKGAGISTATTGYQRQAASMKPAAAPADGYVVCEWEVTLDAGDFQRAGLEYRLNYTSGYKRATVYLFDQHASPTVGKTYRGSKLVVLTNVGSSGAVVDQTDFLWLNNSTLFATQANSAKTITFHKVAWRLATAEEVAAGVTLPTVSAAVTTETSARIAADSAEATTRQALSSKITGATDPSSLTLGTLSSGLLFDERSARTTADSSEVTARQSLSTKVTGATDPSSLTLGTISSGLLYDEKTARSTADSSEVTARQSLSTKVTGAADPSALTLGTISSGLLYDERTARSTADSSEVTARQSLSAKLTGLNDPSGATLSSLSAGLIYDEKTARASADSSMASSISTISATVGGHTSSISTQSTAIADINGRMSGVWAVTLDVNNRISGIKLQTEAGGGTTTSYLDFNADVIRFWNGTANVPAVEVSGGSLFIAGNLVRSQSVQVQAIVSVSNVFSASTITQTNSATYYKGIITMTKTVTDQPLAIDFSIIDEITSGGDFEYYVVIDGDFPISGPPAGVWQTIPLKTGSSATIKDAHSMSFLHDGLTAGSHTFGIYIRNNSGATWTGYQRNLRVTEFKRSV